MGKSSRDKSTKMESSTSSNGNSATTTTSAATTSVTERTPTTAQRDKEVKSLSTNVLSLKFMQRAQEAKHQQNVNAARKKLVDESHWTTTPQDLLVNGVEKELIETLKQRGVVVNDDNSTDEAVIRSTGDTIAYQDIIAGKYDDISKTTFIHVGAQPGISFATSQMRNEPSFLSFLGTSESSTVTLLSRGFINGRKSFGNFSKEVDQLTMRAKEEKDADYLDRKEKLADSKAQSLMTGSAFERGALSGRKGANKRSRYDDDDNNVSGKSGKNGKWDGNNNKKRNNYKKEDEYEQFKNKGGRSDAFLNAPGKSSRFKHL